MAGVGTVAISCWPKVLRTISRPLEREAYRNSRALPSPAVGSIVPTSDFSGLASSICALASAAAREAMESLVRCMIALLAAVTGQQIKTDGAGLRALGANAMAGCFLGILRYEPLQLGLGAFMLEMSRAGAGKDPGELRPGIGSRHIDHAHGRDPRLWWLNAKWFWFLAALDTAPE